MKSKIEKDVQLIEPDFLQKSSLEFLAEELDCQKNEKSTKKQQVKIMRQKGTCGIY